MIIWFALLIPVGVAIYLARYHQRAMAWWEFLIGILPTLVLILILKYSSESMLVQDVEVWGNVLTKAHYYEDWNEKVSCRHPIYCTSGSGKNKTTYVCGHHHSYDVDYHSAYWEADDDEGNTYHITEDQYNTFVKRWGNKIYFTELDHDYHDNDGDKWSINWPGTYETHEFIATEHTWVNKVAKTENALRLPQVDEKIIKQQNLFVYPQITPWMKIPAILADSTIFVPYEAKKKMNWLNGSLGHKKEVRAWILLFKNKSTDAAYYQECLWQRGKQNEFTVCISVDDKNNIQWVRIFSWSDSELLKVESRQEITAMKKLDLVKISDLLYSKISQQFVRKDFKQFDYLTVETPLWAVIMTYVLTILVNFFLARWCIENGLTEDKPFHE